MPSAVRPKPEIKYEKLGRLFLDSKNPRLGRQRVQQGLTQEQVLELMEDWTLDELATSFCENGFWPQEALIAVKERIGKSDELVVVEGNRRLAALKFLARAATGETVPPTWAAIVKDVPNSRLNELSDNIPYILMPDRDSVKSYLGFRHVTGIKEWNPAEKAQFITDLIETDGLDYESVRKRIGSKTPTVRNNYLSYKLLLQMENQAENVDVSKVEDRFSVLYLSIKTEGVRTYLQIDIEGNPQTLRKPVPKSRLKHLEYFARWLFGDAQHEPLFSDSRRVDDFGKMLLSEKTVAYLERTEKPSFDVAKRMAGVSEAEVAEHIETAADEAEEALRAAHTLKTSTRVEGAVVRLGLDALQLAKLFPKAIKEMKDNLV